MYSSWVCLAVFFYWAAKAYLLFAGSMYVFASIWNARQAIRSRDEDSRAVLLLAFFLGLFMILFGIFIF